MESPSQLPANEVSLVSPMNKLSLSDSERTQEARRQKLHPAIHKYYQRDYLLSHTFYSEQLPYAFQRSFSLDHPPPLYCLGIPFLNEEDLLNCAANLPFEEIMSVSRETMFSDHFLEDSEAAVCAINYFFIAAMEKETHGHFHFQWCYLETKRDGEHNAIPVAVYRDNHHPRAMQTAEGAREEVKRVMEQYLFPDELWTRRGTFWMLARDAVFEEDETPRPQNMCPACDPPYSPFGTSSLLS